ncbi:PREDICTED: UPF0609 protein C4orf27 homolog [Polistes canadensis]|uniref:UPF0609 protein C4orf27 homolog n=1 Tax=Polistes canadensis TaxID=91411 RepID=UPI000718E668|nr:PREDICTED: UPF0609 protein C4orf27 homolog [Polistes canadensis]
MSDNDKEEAFLAYKNDSRIPCRYGVKCYQKNQMHHDKYKHPPSNKQKTNIVKRKPLIGNKRKIAEIDDDDDNKEEAVPISVPSKIQKVKTDLINTNVDDTENVIDYVETGDKHLVTTSNDEKVIDDNTAEIKEESDVSSDNSNHVNDDDSCTDTCTILSPTCIKENIKNLLLVEMPEDFYQFYDFCKLISEKEPLMALKSINLYLVGPFDIISNKLKSYKNNDKEKYLRHWRYYYDPPEFQTIIRGNKDGLHLGYWRDECNEKPIYVAKNKADIDCIIQPVAENIFGAINICIEDKWKTANLFEKTSIVQLQKKLKEFAQKYDITLEKKTDKMINREKKVIVRTFHKAGIVVPYNKKTQLGYRELSVTDKELQQILKKMDEASSSEERKKIMCKLDEIVRLATIAADECDFGTCLELAHDLFSSGSVYVQTIALQMFSVAYTHLDRPEFLEIIKAHLKNRKRGSDLSVI